MTGESIIYFNKEYGENHTSADHVFEYLARGNKVLWVNSIATRNPSLGSAHDWGRVWRKIRKLFAGRQQLGPSAWLYQPFFIPLPYLKLAQNLNRFLLRWSVRRQVRKLGMKDVQLWTFLPTAVYMLGELDETVSVYYCVDAWSKFAHLPGGKIAPLEAKLIRQTDICFGTSASLRDHLREGNPNSWLARHGVDYEVFSRALDPRLEVPADLAALPKPIIGFFGGLLTHIDFDLLAAVARSHPEWSLVLVGKVQASLECFAGLPNVHVLGPRPYEQLPAYCKGFDIGIIPYLCNEFTAHVNPIKLRQYLCAGLPVVATPIPEVLEYRELVSLGSSAEEWVKSIERELAADSPESRLARSQAMRNETWDRKLLMVCEKVMEAKRRRQGGTSRPQRGGRASVS